MLATFMQNVSALKLTIPGLIDPVTVQLGVCVSVRFLVSQFDMVLQVIPSNGTRSVIFSTYWT